MARIKKDTKNLTEEGRLTTKMAEEAMDAIWRVIREEIEQRRKEGKDVDIQKKCGISGGQINKSQSLKCPPAITFRKILQLIYGLDISFHRIIFALNTNAYRAMKFFESLSIEDIRRLGALSSEDLDRLQQVIRAYLASAPSATDQNSPRKSNQNK